MVETLVYLVQLVYERDKHTILWNQRSYIIQSYLGDDHRLSRLEVIFKEVVWRYCLFKAVNWLQCRRHMYHFLEFQELTLQLQPKESFLVSRHVQFCSARSLCFTATRGTTSRKSLCWNKLKRQFHRIICYDKSFWIQYIWRKNSS